MKHKLFPGLWAGSSIHIILQLMLAFEQEYPEALTGITDHVLVFAVCFTISLQEYFCFHFVSRQFQKTLLRYQILLHLCMRFLK